MNGAAEHSNAGRTGHLYEALEKGDAQIDELLAENLVWHVRGWATRRWTGRRRNSVAGSATTS